VNTGGARKLIFGRGTKLTVDSSKFIMFSATHIDMNTLSDFEQIATIVKT